VNNSNSLFSWGELELESIDSKTSNAGFPEQFEKFFFVNHPGSQGKPSLLRGELIYMVMASQCAQSLTLQGCWLLEIQSDFLIEDANEDLAAD